MEIIKDFIMELGMPGLFLSMFLEGSSAPFPGIIVVLTYGYAMNMALVETILISAVMSLIYSLASFIPYFLGIKTENWIKKKFAKKLASAQAWFNRYGLWSICLSRPFALGNYISYAAGISKVSKIKYFLYTFMGIFPWSIAVLLIGKSGKEINFSQWIDMKTVIFIALGFVGVFLIKKIVMKKKIKQKIKKQLKYIF